MIEGKTWVFHEVPKTASTSLREALKPLSTNHLAQHAKHEEVGQRVPRDKYQFCTVRNTYERAVSIWNHVCKQHTPFPEFMQRLRGIYRSRVFIKPQWYWAKDCDFVMDFDNLDRDFRSVCKRIDLPEIEVPKRNVGKYSKGRDWRSFYNEKALKYVEEIYEQDLLAFDHKFE